MKTFVETVEAANAGRKWWIVDAKGKVVGRVASQVAAILRGKRNPRYTPNIDTGDHVVIINAAEIEFTGGKEAKKVYYKHTGFVGSVKEKTAGQLLAQDPEAVVTGAVQGMLPKNALGRKQLSKLKVYAGSEHPHAAQSPQKIEL